MVTSRDLSSSIEGQLAMMPSFRAVGVIDETESNSVICGALQSLAAIMRLQYRDDRTE